MKVKDFLNSPEKWTRGVLAKGKFKRSINPESEEACSWCLLGAIIKCYDNDLEKMKAKNKIHQVLLTMGYIIQDSFDAIVIFNDESTTTFEEIRLVIEEADV